MLVSMFTFDMSLKLFFSLTKQVTMMTLMFFVTICVIRSFMASSFRGGNGNVWLHGRFRFFLFHGIFFRFERLRLEVYLFRPLLFLLCQFLLLGFLLLRRLLYRLLVPHRTSLPEAFLEGVHVSVFVLLLHGDDFTIDYRIVAQRHGPLLRVLHVDFLLLNPADPCGELEIVRHSGRKHDDTDCVW